MEDLFKRLFSGSEVKVPKKVRESLRSHFGHVVNLEWSWKDSQFEAIFYHDQLEHIAHFHPGGEMLNYKKNLPISDLPAEIMSVASTKGEIMHVIEIHLEKEICYDMIVRDPSLVRSEIHINEHGSITSDKLL